MSAAWSDENPPAVSGRSPPSARPAKPVSDTSPTRRRTQWARTHVLPCMVGKWIYQTRARAGRARLGRARRPPAQAPDLGPRAGPDMRTPGPRAPAGCLPWRPSASTPPATRARSPRRSWLRLEHGGGACVRTLGVPVRVCAAAVCAKGAGCGCCLQRDLSMQDQRSGGATARVRPASYMLRLLSRRAEEHGRRRLGSAAPEV